MKAIDWETLIARERRRALRQQAGVQAASNSREIGRAGPRLQPVRAKLRRLIHSRAPQSDLQPRERAPLEAIRPPCWSS